MNQAALLASSALVSVVCAAAVATLTRPDSPGDSGPFGDSAKREAVGDQLSLRIEALAAEQDDLRASIEKLAKRIETGTGPSSRTEVVPPLDQDRLELAIERVLERLSAEHHRNEPSVDRAKLMPLLERLLDGNASESERAEVWSRLHDEGLLDAAVAEFERRAEAAPFDTMAQTELGWAYFQKMVTAGGGPETGHWGSKGAVALERALEFDEHNWDARFSLARHLYYADLGADSMREFETLVAQQSGRVAKERHAQAFLWLGNLHASQGDLGRAKELWRAGLEHLPGNAVLTARLSEFD